MSEDKETKILAIVLRNVSTIKKSNNVTRWILVGDLRSWFYASEQSRIANNAARECCVMNYL